MSGRNLNLRFDVCLTLEERPPAGCVGCSKSVGARTPGIKNVQAIKSFIHRSSVLSGFLQVQRVRRAGAQSENQAL
jgi:hypothetical protein